MALIFFPLALPDVQQQKPFLEEIHSEFTESLNTYVGGAMAFSKEVVKMLFDQNGQTLLEDGGEKKGTLIFTETLGAMRTNANFAAYGASRSGARSLAQALAKEYSPSKCAFVFIFRSVPCTKSHDILNSLIQQTHFIIH